VTPFARRLLIVTALELAGAFAAIVLAGAMLALGTYAAVLRGDMSSALDRVVAALSTEAATHDVRIAGVLAASRYPRSSVVVLLVDERRRVEVYQPVGRARAPVVDVRRRGEVGGAPRATNAFARIVLGLVTAFGVQNERAHVGTIDVIVRPNEASLVATVGAHVWELVVALVLGLAAAFLLANKLTRQVLRPLVDVQNALERFAAGDLSPQPIVADHRHELRSLAVAYNGAIDQMQRAFAERDRANGAMRQFVGDAGHQLRTPLTVIRGFIAILRKGELRSPQDYDRILATMNRQSLIMGSLVEKLMLLDRWEDAQRGWAEPIAVGRLAHDVIAPLAEAQPLRDVRVDVGPGPLVAIDPSDLAHALTNIVDNALKYTRGAVGVSVVAGDDILEISIADEGPGMTPDEVAHVFDRFYRGARRDVEGSGLGLAIAKRAIERAGGTLSLQSDPRTGSRFTIALPATRASRSQTTPLVR